MVFPSTRDSFKTHILHWVSYAYCTKNKTTFCLRNDEASPDDRLVGAKRAAVQTVLDLHPDARHELFNIVSTFGWEGILT